MVDLKSTKTSGKYIKSGIDIKDNDNVEKFNQDAKYYPYWIVKTRNWYDPEGLNIPDHKLNIQFAGTLSECKKKLQKIKDEAKSDPDWQYIQDAGSMYVTIYYPHAIAKSTFEIVENAERLFSDDNTQRICDDIKDIFSEMEEQGWGSKYFEHYFYDDSCQVLDVLGNDLMVSYYDIDGMPDDTYRMSIFMYIEPDSLYFCKSLENYADYEPPKGIDIDVRNYKFSDYNSAEELLSDVSKNINEGIPEKYKNVDGDYLKASKKIVGSFWNPCKYFDILVGMEQIDTNEWNRSSREERDAMVLPYIKQFWAKYKDEMTDEDLDALFDDLEDSNFHTECRLLADIVDNDTAGYIGASKAILGDDNWHDKEEIVFFKYPQLDILTSFWANDNVRDAFLKDVEEQTDGIIYVIDPSEFSVKLRDSWNNEIDYRNQMLAHRKLLELIDKYGKIYIDGGR